MSVDREKLIEAAARRMVDDETLLVHTCPLVAAVLDALAPLIADAIEAKRAEHFAEYGNEETGPRNYDWALTHASDLVRSLGGNDSEAES